jgi:UDP-glucuronate 4-epimerase
MRVLVTGAAGFIGSHLAEALLRRGDEVIALDNFSDYYSPARKRANLACFQDHPCLTFYEADIRDAAKMQRIVADHCPDAIAHMAAMAGVRYSIGRASLYIAVNLQGTVNLLEAARGCSVPHFVFASTSSVYGKTERIPFEESDPCNLPLAPYPATKKAAELMGYTYHNLHHLNFTAVRFFSVYGPRGRPDMMPYLVMERTVKGQEIQLFDAGQMKRDWTYVNDIVAGIVAAIDKPLGYEIINLGRGEPVLMADFVRVVEELVGKRAILSTPPAPPSEPKINFADIGKARLLLNYQPATPVAEGLAHLWAWYQSDILLTR